MKINRVIYALLLAATSMAAAAPPPNDNFADRIVIPSVPATVTGTTVAATLEPDEPTGYRLSSTVWYEWVAPAAGTLVVRLVGCTNSTVCHVLAGKVLTELRGLPGRSAGCYTSESGSDGRVRVEAGTTCQLRVSPSPTSATLAQSSFTLHLELVPPLANDHFADRIVIPSVPAAVRGTTEDGTVEPGEPPFMKQLSTVWYEWVAPRNGILRVRITDTQWSHRTMVLARVFSGTVLTELRYVGSASDKYEGNMDVVQGVAYQFQVWPDEPYSLPSNDGPFTLHLEYNAPPANDHFTNRIRLTNRAERIEYRAVGTTLEAGEDSLSNSGRTVWYQWKAPESGTVRIWTDGAAGVYSGTEERRGALLTNACYNLSFTAVAGQIYQLVFDDCGAPDRHRPFTHSWTLSLNGASLLNLNRLTNGTLQLNLYGDPSRAYALEASTNLLEWTGPVSAIANDPTNHPRRFYRARPLEEPPP